MSKTLSRTLLILVCTMLLASCAGYQKHLERRNQAVLNLQEKKAHQGDADEQYAQGMFYETGTMGKSLDYVKAAQWLELSAKQGNPLAQFKLSQLYFEGKGVPQNSTKAIELVRAAADGGYYVAMLMYGQMLRTGTQGLQVEPDRAFPYLKAAADQDVLEAQVAVSNMYFKGEGIPKDPIMAYVYAKLAAVNVERGPPQEEAKRRERRMNAAKNVNNLYIRMSPQDQRLAEQKFDAWKPMPKLKRKYLRES